MRVLRDKQFLFMLLSLLMFVTRVTEATPQDLGVRLMTDILTQVPGNKVMIRKDGVSRVYVADAASYVPPISIGTGPFELTLRQKATASGIVVGQRFDVNFPASGPDYFYYYNVFQPVLQPVVVDSGFSGYVEGIAGRWALQSFEESQFAFSANVGSLLTPNEISAMSRYYGFSLLREDYKAGLVISVSDAEPIDGGLGLEMDFWNYGFATAPACDVYHVAPDTASMGGGSLSASAFMWDPSRNPDLYYYYLSGTLGAGFNVLLFSEMATSEFSSVLADPPTFPPATASPSGTSTGIQPCVPAAPDPTPGAVCRVGDDDKCEDDSDCPDSGCTSDMTPGNCTSDVNRIGPAFCGGSDADGASSKKTRCWGVFNRGSSSYEIRFGTSNDLVGGSFGESEEEGAEASDCTEMSVANGPDAPCGQCSQLFIEVVRCSKVCTVHVERFACLLLRFYCTDKQCPSACIDVVSETVEHCSRDCP